MPLVSVVIPTFNRAHDLERALRSVLAQSFADWEIIVVDNHSTDGTVDLVNRIADRRIRLELIHNNGIIAASRNLGISKANGKYVSFLDSDDWWTPEKLRLCVLALDAGADVVYHDLYLVRSAARKTHAPAKTGRHLKRPVFEDLLLGGNGLANSSVVVRKALLDRIGPLTEAAQFVGIEDFEAWLRLARITDNFVMLDQVLGYYWLGGGNMTNPERTLRTTEAIERHFQTEIAGLDGKADWLRYSRGKAMFAMGQFKKAREELRKISLLRQPPMMMAKISYMRLSAALRVDA
jgi:glycosyltransferase involved in cell wall biosynthesis